MRKLGAHQYAGVYGHRNNGLQQQANELGRELGVDVRLRNGSYCVMGYSAPDLAGVRTLVARLKRSAKAALCRTSEE